MSEQRVDDNRARRLFECAQEWTPEGPQRVSAKEQQAQNQCIYDLSHDLIKSRREIAQQKALIKEMIAYAKRTLTFWFADDKHTVGKRLLFMAGQEPTTPNQEQGTQLAKFFEQLRLEEEKPNATHQQ